MENIINLSERLIALIERAEAEARDIVSKAQREADEMLLEVKEEADKKRLRAQRRTGLDEFLAPEEEKARIEANKVKEEYEKRASNIRNIPEEKIAQAVDFVLKEIQPK